MIEFSEIALRLVKKGNFALEPRCCPDQFVGVISEIEKNGIFSCRNSASERPPNLQCVLLILESPHISEFYDTPGPAKGMTGKNIIKYISKVSGLEVKGDFGLILVNAVQHQCSLGKSTKEWRDKVFVETWTNGGRLNFESRLVALYQDGDCIVNCCTRGYSKNVVSHLRSRVQNAIFSKLLSIPVQ